MKNEKSRILLAMSRDRRPPLLGQLKACGIEVLAASDVADVRRMLAVGLPVEVVITDATLPDGDWRSVMEQVAQHSVQVEVVVCARSPEVGFWLDTLDQGAYDVLVEPFEIEEVRRIVSGAVVRSSWNPVARRRLGDLQVSNIPPLAVGVSAINERVPGF